MRLANWLALPIGALACSGPAPAPPAPPALPVIALAPPAAELATHWRYHPAELAARRTRALADGSELLVGQGGERWLRDRDGAARASAYRAPETLVDALPWPDGRWLFVGESGAVYTADAPLGPLTAAAAPPTPLTRVRAGGTQLLGLDSAGKLYRFEGQGWVESGAPEPRAFDVAFAPGGALLALAAPEALLTSSDAGRSWQRLDVAPFGAQRLLAEPRGVRIEGLGGAFLWTGASALEALDGAAAVEVSPPAVQGERGPRAAALAAGEAALTGERYYEVRLTEAEGELDWQLWHGRLDQPPAARAIAEAQGCSQLRLGASGARVRLACSRVAAHDRVLVRVLASDDGGAKFRETAVLAAADTQSIALAVAPDGTTLVTGACLAKEEACDPREPIVVAGDRAELAKVNDLVDLPAAPAFALDGGSAYFFGRRAKDEELALFVSRDGGRSFRSRALALPPEPDGDERAWSPSGDSSDRTICPGPDGELGLVLGQTPPLYVLADADGRIGSIAKLPPHTALVAGFGHQVLALGIAEESLRSVARAAVWESSDGGQSFRPVAVPMGLAIEELGSPVEIRCAASGCVIGQVATRVGWGPSDDLAPPSGGPAPDESPTVPSVRPPIACELDEKRGWTAIGDVHAWGGGAFALVPSAGQVLRGGSAWSLLRHVGATGETVAVSAALRDGRIENKTLFAPSRERALFAFDVTRQMEGYAVARLRVPRADSLGTIELAWINYMTAREGRAAVPKSGALGDLKPGAPIVLDAALLSVSPGGMFLRPHKDSAETVFVDVDGKIGAPLPYPGWSFDGLDAREQDAVQAAGRSLAVAMLRDRDSGALRAVALRPLDAPDAPIHYVTLTPPDSPLRIETHWDYRGGEVGVVSTVIDDANGSAYAFFAPFSPSGGLGAPEPAPTQLDVAVPPRVCSDEERRASARVVAPYVDGTRHPVLVSSSLESYVLITREEVLHGTPDKACAAGWFAHQVSRTGSELVAVIGASLERSWLFRPTPGVVRSVEVRAMRCRLAPEESVPPLVWGERGTLVSAAARSQR